MTCTTWEPSGSLTSHPDRAGPNDDHRDLAELAYAELRCHKQLGPACAQLLHRVVTAVVRGPSGTVRFPTLEGAWVWAEDDRLAATHEIFLHLLTTEHTQRLFERCGSGESLEAALWTRSRSWFQDRARTTDKGAFQRKLTAALQHGLSAGTLVATEWDSERVWSRPGVGAGAVPLGFDELARAAAEVEVPELRYHSRRRRDPRTTREGLLTIVVAVLDRNGGGLPQSTIRDVCIQRLGLSPAPEAQQTDEAFGDVQRAAQIEDTDPPWDDPADEWLLDLHVRGVLEQLDSDAARAISVYVENGVSGVGRAFGTKRAASAQRVRAARIKLDRLVTSTGHGAWEQALAERALTALAAQPARRCRVVRRLCMLGACGSDGTSGPSMSAAHR